MKTLIFTIEAPAAFLNVNDRPHYHLKAKLTKAWREATAAHAATRVIRITRNTPKIPGNKRNLDRIRAASEVLATPSEA